MAFYHVFKNSGLGIHVLIYLNGHRYDLNVIKIEKIKDEKHKVNLIRKALLINLINHID